jgi:hypothetical protein
VVRNELRGQTRSESNAVQVNGSTSAHETIIAVCGCVLRRTCDFEQVALCQRTFRPLFDSVQQIVSPDVLLLLLLQFRTQPHLGCPDALQITLSCTNSGTTTVLD